MYDLNNNIFASNIKFYRKSRNITMKQLGESIGKTKATVSKYENGEIIPDIITILEICNTLDISISQLFPTNKMEHNNKYNPFSTNIVYMYYYTENLLVTSVIELIEDKNEIRVKYYNGVKDIEKYAENNSYSYEGVLTCDKAIGYIELSNTSTKSTLFEKIQISFLIPWSTNFEMTNFFILGLTPNANPIVKKGILSIHPITNFENFNDDLKITEDEIKEIKKNNNWILNNKNYNHFYYDK